MGSQRPGQVRLTTFGITTALAALLLVRATPQASGKHYAVLVGVNHYEHEKLSNLSYAERDATELASLLTKAGYEVTLLTDSTGKDDANRRPTKANIESALRATLRACRKGDTVVIGLAGHGLQFSHQTDGFFCPADARPFRDEAATMLSLKSLYAEMERSFAGMKVLFVDACRDEPPTSQTAGRGINADNTPRPPQGVAALFSCRGGERSFETKKLRHGIFFYHVLQGLKGEARDRKGRVTFAGLAAHVAQEVPESVTSLVGGGAKQSPNLKADYSGEPVLMAGPIPSPSSSDAGSQQKAAPPPVSPGGGKGRLIDTTGLGKMTERMRLHDAVNSLNGHNGEGAEERRKAVAVIRQFAEAGHAPSQYWMGMIYAFGYHVVPVSQNQAAVWWSKSAAGGDASSMVELGWTHRSGYGSVQDSDKAERLFKSAREAVERQAQDGLAPAQNTLGLMAAHGLGMPLDGAAAIRWYKKAADQGYAGAQSWLGTMHEQGIGVQRDAAQSLRWYLVAAKQGHVWGEYNAGIAYLTGKGTARDDAEGGRWLEKAAAQELSFAQYYLGWMYENGRGLVQSDQQALSNYRRAAASGHAEAAKAVRRLEGGR